MNNTLWIMFVITAFVIGAFVGQITAPKPKSFTIPMDVPFWTHRDDLPSETDNSADNQTINLRWQDKATTIRYHVPSNNSTVYKLERGTTYITHAWGHWNE